MKRPQVKVRLIAISCALDGLLATGAGLVATRFALRPPTLSELPVLLKEGRFDEVEVKLRRFLEFHPQHSQANMLMAQAVLARPDQKPSLAPAHLRRVQASTREEMAIIRLNEGKACSAVGRNSLAEESWLEAFRLDPLVPEAGWNLLGLIHVAGRRQDSHRLALTLFEREPDAHDRVQLLLELLRQDAQPLGADSLIETFEPLVKNHPDDKTAAITLGRAYIRNSLFDEGLALLQGAVGRWPNDPFAWEALLWGLDESSRIDELESWLNRVLPAIASESRFARFRGALALKLLVWQEAANWFLVAFKHDQSDPQVLCRLCQALRFAGRPGDLPEYESRFLALRAAFDRALPLYREANTTMNLGTAPHAELNHHLAENRERIGQPAEARAWHRLVLADRSDDAVSRSALARLAAQDTGK
jgi:tetratricopeptide (TPR) repeat protein